MVFPNLCSTFVSGKSGAVGYNFVVDLYISIKNCIYIHFFRKRHFLKKPFSSMLKIDHISFCRHSCFRAFRYSASFSFCSNALPRFFSSIVGIFLPGLAKSSPKFVKFTHSPSVLIVFSLRMIEFILLH